MIMTGCSNIPILKRNSAENGYKKQQIVYHLNDVNSAYGVLRNINNHLNALGQDNAKIIAVAHSSGAYALVEGTHDKRGHTFSMSVQKLARRGVTFQICANTIRNKKIPKNSINPNAKIIPSGVDQVINLQQEGYLYIKP